MIPEIGPYVLDRTVFETPLGRFVIAPGLIGMSPTQSKSTGNQQTVSLLYTFDPASNADIPILLKR